MCRSGRSVDVTIGSSTPLASAKTRWNSSAAYASLGNASAATTMSQPDNCVRSTAPGATSAAFVIFAANQITAINPGKKARRMGCSFGREEIAGVTAVHCKPRTGGTQRAADQSRITIVAFRSAKVAIRSRSVRRRRPPLLWSKRRQWNRYFRGAKGDFLCRLTNQSASFCER